MSRERLVWAGALAALLGGGCEAPVAEVVVVVRAEPALAPLLRNVRVEARRRGATATIVNRTFAVAMNPLPGRVAIIAADPDDARPLEVNVTADVGDPGRGDFTHRVVTRFQKNAVLYVDVVLADGCRDVARRSTCAGIGTTCGEMGRCVSVERQGTQAAPGGDAGGPDAGFMCRAPPTGMAPTVMQACTMELFALPDRCGDGLDNNCNGVADEGCCAQSCVGATGQSARHCDEVTLLGGTLTLGAADAPPDTFASPPVTGVSVSRYRIDAYEVTVARFRRFVAAGMPKPPADVVVYPRGVVFAPEPRGAWPVTLPDPDGGRPLPDSGTTDRLCNWTPTPGEWESNPINCVDWYTAMAFCVWDGGRLPTEAEWEFAARFRPHVDDSGNALRPGRRYPWGDRPPTCNDANVAGCDVGYLRGTRPVGTQMNGLRLQLPWLGIYDLTGNVAELVADGFHGYGSTCWTSSGTNDFSPADPVCGQRPPSAMTSHIPVTRGGSYSEDDVHLHAYARASAGGRRSMANYVGFRCVRAW